MVALTMNPNAHPTDRIIAENIRSLIEQARLEKDKQRGTRGGLATLTGIPRTTLNRYLQAHTSIRMTDLLAIADAFNVTIFSMLVEYNGGAAEMRAAA